MTEDNIIRVLIVEDSPLYREMLRDVLVSLPNIRLVGAVGDGRSAIELVDQVNPQVILMDISLPGSIDGIEAGHRIKDKNPQIGIVLLTVHNEERIVKRLPREAGWSFLWKQSASNSTQTLLQTIEQTAKGFVVIDPDIIRLLEPAPDSSITQLSPRCMETLKLIAQGYSNEAIAEKLVVDKRAVEKYVNTIFSTLGLTGSKIHDPRVEAVLKYLREAGFLKDRGQDEERHKDDIDKG